MSSLRERDWLTVLLELSVVVVGIFLGLQVDGWSRDRVDRAAERVYLERLDADLEETLTSLRSDRDDLDRWFTQTRALVEGLRMGTAGRDVVDENRGALLASTRVFVGRAQLATITELVRGGRLQIIRDPDIRGAIAATEGLTESRRLQIQVLSRQQQVLAEIIRPRYRLTEHPDGTWGAVEYDFASLVGDDLLVHALSQAAENLRVNVIWIDEVIEEMEVLERLVAAVDREGPQS